MKRTGRYHLESLLSFSEQLSLLGPHVRAKLNCEAGAKHRHTIVDGCSSNLLRRALDLAHLKRSCNCGVFIETTLAKFAGIMSNESGHICNSV